jgi:hypothetical protein
MADLKRIIVDALPLIEQDPPTTTQEPPSPKLILAGSGLVNK